MLANRPGNSARVATRPGLNVKSKAILAIGLSLAFSAVPLPTVSADLVAFRGSTSGGPLFDRPLPNGGDPPATTAGEPSAFEVLRFTVNRSGAYDLLTYALTPYGWDNATVLYEGKFDPADPLRNAVAANDDLGGIGRAGFRGIALEAGRDYALVTTGFDASTSGAYLATVRGPEQVRRGTATLASFGGTTVGGPTWNRPLDAFEPNEPPTGLSLVGTDVSYQAREFRVESSGRYTILVEGIDPLDWDNFAALYRGEFDPSNPLSGIISANEDLARVVGAAGFFEVALAPGDYTLVVSGYGNADVGAFEAHVFGELAIVPEPTSLGSLALGLTCSILVATLGWSRRGPGGFKLPRSKPQC